MGFTEKETIAGQKDKIKRLITNDGETEIGVRFDKETVWLTLNQLADLFGRDKSVISRHLKNIFSTLELDKNSVVAKNATVQTEGKRQVEREIEYFNFDAIISIGCRVNSKQHTQFRIRATKRLKAYLIQGYSVNQKRLEERIHGSTSPGSTIPN